jgi:hypothetical protein
VRDKRPNLVFLMETKLLQRKTICLKAKLGFDQIFVVDCKGRSGGLILLWRSTLQVEIQNYSRRHVNAVITPSTGSAWKLTRFYGHPEAAKRAEAWSLLRYLSKLNPEPWLCVGD